MFCLDISITFSLFPPLINHDISFVINHLKLWTAPTTSGINTSGPLLTLLCLYAFIIPLCSVSSWILFVVPEDLYKRMNYVSKLVLSHCGLSPQYLALGYHTECWGRERYWVGNIGDRWIGIGVTQPCDRWGIITTKCIEICIRYQLSCSSFHHDTRLHRPLCPSWSSNQVWRACNSSCIIMLYPWYLKK